MYKYKYPSLKYKYKDKYLVFTASTYQVRKCQRKNIAFFKYKFIIYYSYTEKYNLINKYGCFELIILLNR